MGMFDIIRVDDKIPLPEFPEDGKRDQFQTKDMRGGPQGAIYVITEQGRLVEEVYEYIEGSAEQKIQTIGNVDVPLLNAKFVGVEDINFHGEFEFYTIIEGEENSKDEWIEFKAKFTDGNLVNISVKAKHNIPDPRRIITQDKKIIIPH